MSPIVNANGNKFVAVAIQYRVSASLMEQEAKGAYSRKQFDNQSIAGSFWIFVVRRGHAVRSRQCRLA